MKLLLALLALQDDVTGDWYGALEITGAKLRLVIHIAKDGDGLKGTMDSPDQGANGLKLDDVAFKDGKLTFVFKAANGSYEGTLKDGKFEGTWTQNGAWPLPLSRTKPEPPKRPQNPAKPYPYDEEEVSYESAATKSKMGGTLTLPRSKGPHPAVLLITGSGAQDRDETLMDHKPFLVLADHLTRKGVAVLRVDDRGIGKSTVGDHGKSTSADFADDALAGVEYLRTRKEIDPKKIGLCGHSEGGLIAPMCAAKSEQVAFIVLMAGPGLRGDEILAMQTELISKAAGLPDAMVARNTERNKKIYAIVREEKDDAAAQKKILDLFADSPEAERKGMEMQVRQLVSPWFRFFMTYDPAPTLAKVKCPVFALNGEKDLQVPCKEDLEAIQKACPHADTLALPDLNHLFQTCKTGAPAEYAQIEETFAPAALEAISSWILKTVR